jgi:hypothetical protein
MGDSLALRMVLAYKLETKSTLNALGNKTSKL